jgi:uridine kinase
MCKLTINGKTVTYPQGTTYEQIAKEYQTEYEQRIVLVFFNGKLRELNKKVKEDGTLSFVTSDQKPGAKAYRRSLVLLMQKALYDLYGEQGVGVRVLQTTGNGQYCELSGTPMEMTDACLEALAGRMKELVDADLPIKKKSRTTAEAVKLFHDRGMSDKEKLFG